MVASPTATANMKNTGGNKNNNNGGDDWSGGAGVLPGRAAAGPLFLMAVTPVFAMVFFHVCAVHSGNFAQFFQSVAAAVRNSSNKEGGTPQPLWRVVYDLWPDPWDATTWRMVTAFLAFELLLLRALPGAAFAATVTPSGHRPVYTANGVPAYAVTLVALLALHHTGVFDAALIYDKFGNILATMNVVALAFCALLLVKGYVAPSSSSSRLGSGNSDSGTTGSWITDFYWGMELYPRIFGWDVKQFTNCRAGMMFWAVAVLSFCYKNMQLNGGQLQYGLAVSVALQLVYCSKFFYWEMGYMCSMDIQHDRAGYYICWGCLVWVPAVYTSAAFYLTASGPKISAPAALFLFAAGLLCIWINYDSDRQRYVFRQTNGECLIWGRPPRHIVASYQTTNSSKKGGNNKGETKTSLLLVDGWWKISRHFHYVPEILASFFWSAPALNSALIAPYFYVIYLTILLTDRAFRDDSRCRAKYGPFWDEYCATVPYKIVPGVV